jgi:cyclophilin family peptidyl-prolyl cis-trans isomerase
MLRPRAKTKPSSSSQNSGPTSEDSSTQAGGKRTHHGTTTIVLLLAVFFITISAYTGRYYWWYDSSSKATGEGGNNNITSKGGSRRKSNQLRVAGGDEHSGDPVVANSGETLVLTTSVGVLRILLRPDLSPESVNYIRNVVADGHCSLCNLYRVEKPGILQGILKHPHLPVPTVKGQCPVDAINIPNQCPPHDASCGCHGPVMTRGMVGWAAGVTGPDFFVNAYKQPAKWWGTQHTVWGEIRHDDAVSWAVIDDIWQRPSERRGDLTYLVDSLHFDLRIE